MMGTRWMWWLLAAGVVQGLELTPEQYYQMPRLFAMDDMAQCLETSARGLYCMGTLALSSTQPSQMLDVLQQYSDDPHHFNHTLLHRGYCVSSRCPAASLPPSSRFERCVSDTAAERYGLKAKLVKLDYCTTSVDVRRNRPYDTAELAFAVVVAVLLFCNAVGTLYDVFRNQDDKPNPYLMAWSVRASWRRLTATHESGDPRLSALAPVQGIRAMTLMVVMMAHSVLGHYMSYMYNVDFIEQVHQHPMAMLIRNGTMVVQGFFVISSFLLTYNLLLMGETGTETGRRAPSFRMLPSMLLHRFIRIAPVHMLAVGFQATWYARVSYGPMWEPLVGTEVANCRKKWWTHLFFLNNLIYVDNMCLLPSWFLAADMQLYVVCSVLALLLARRPRWVPATLALLLLATIGANFLAAYHFHLQPMVKVITAEMMRADYVTHASFKWLYAAAWGSIPSALIGIGLAFLYHHLKTINYPLHENRVFCWIYRVFYALLTCWIMSGIWWRTQDDPVVVAAYATLERPVYAFGMALGLLGMFWGLRSVWLTAFGLSCWRSLGRLSLGVLLLHWPHSQGQLAVRTAPLHVSVYLVGGHLFTTMFMTYLTAMLLYLLVETPVQKFLDALFIPNKTK